MDKIDRAIVNTLQQEFPLSERPFAEAAALLGLSESDLIERVETMLEDRVLTRFGPLFQAERLGGAYALAAMRVPAADFAHHARHLHFVAAPADNGPRIIEIHAIQRRRETVGVALAPHFTIGDDVQPHLLLRADGLSRGVALGFAEPGFLDEPQFRGARAGGKASGELAAVDEPFRLRIAAHPRIAPARSESALCGPARRGH